MTRGLPQLRTPQRETAAAPADGRGRKPPPDQVFYCRLAYALYARRAIEGADESAGRIRPIYCALLVAEGARRPIAAAISGGAGSPGYLESPDSRAAVRRVEFLKRTGYRCAYQQTAAGPSIHATWAPGYFEVEPPASADLDEEASDLGAMVRLCSMPPLADLLAAATEPRWEEAQRWAYELGLEGPDPRDPRRAVLGPAAAWWCAQLDRRVAAPMLHDARFQVQTLLAAARSSAVNGMALPRPSATAPIALWPAGAYPGAQEWGRGADRVGRAEASAKGSDGLHFAEVGLRAREFGLSDPILTIARDSALRHLLARECRAFEAAAAAPAGGRRAAYEAAVAAAEAERLEDLLRVQAQREARKAKP